MLQCDNSHKNECMARKFLTKFRTTANNSLSATAVTFRLVPCIETTYAEQETQPLLTNRATHMCNMQWRGSPSKTRPSRYVLPR